jgi:hypothetical protein
MLLTSTAACGPLLECGYAGSLGAGLTLGTKKAASPDVMDGGSMHFTERFPKDRSAEFGAQTQSHWLFSSMAASGRKSRMTPSL